MATNSSILAWRILWTEEPGRPVLGGPKRQTGLRTNTTPSLASCCSVTKSCLTLCNPMNCSTPGFPVLHNLPEFAQTYVHSVNDAIQPSDPLSPTSPLALNISQNRSLFQRTGFLQQVAKGLELQLQHQSFQ